MGLNRPFYLENIMKLIIALFFAVTVALPAHAIVGNIGRGMNLDYAKAVVAESVEKIFVNVKANGAIGAGAVASWDLTAKDGATVVIAPVSGLAPACIMVNACATGALCSCQVYGPFSSALFDSVSGAGVAGTKVVIGTANAGYIAHKAVDVATDVSLGYFFDAPSASSSVSIFIKLL
jgi:hypothetical protein